MKKLIQISSIIAATVTLLLTTSGLSQAGNYGPPRHGINVSFYDCYGPNRYWHGGIYYDCHADYDLWAEWFRGKTDGRVWVPAVWYV